MPSTSLVIESWSHVSDTPGYEEAAGQTLFRNIFQIAPEAQHMFGFGKEFPIGCEEVYKTEQFRRHTVNVVSTINTAIAMLSRSSLEDLVIALKDLGVKHAEYEAKKEHYEVVGKALILTLEKVLSAKGEWNDNVKAAWVDVYQLIQDTMLLGAAEYFENEAIGTNGAEEGQSCINLVKKSWAEVKDKVVDHERVIGGLLFRRLFAKIPDVQNKFGFGRELPIGSEELYKLERFEHHATLVIKAVDKVIKLLRPNNLTYSKAYLFELGALHAEHQTTKEQYDLFATCFTEVLQDVLGDDSFSVADSKAWTETFDIITTAMVEGVESF
mmetsp:Transcript_65319/g.98534  ORF Transcript_65319/g.98534 Transcript_65319/m.98534 type:complete len:327 (-) Transcript_65319:28-1008(-)|eukprot:CAMPEP_0117034088 /NCGR_PEP_ID=MMETSP0472-20121206/24302_1 /TAXON_ID=693140 ORGANISM="Tiarina fusus, Strain LIS" /NCGR_SAMPLE_ID=MMETSP0472 /ASSEMBLY_ACC=CAM_ASM_000603 /LENGTH=326 /DNA_ID=CAMNT_0004743175 /DNA_START=53 /DNA_END=1033 /DNA_ORIENTATION=+